MDSEFLKEPSVTDDTLKDNSVDSEFLKESSVTDELLIDSIVTDDPLKVPSVIDSSFKPPKESSGIDGILKPLDPTVVDSNDDLKVFLMQELLQSLHHCAGFSILPVSIAGLKPLFSSRWQLFFPFSLQNSLDELHLDTKSLFELVLSDPQFEGLLPNLSHSAAVQAVAEAMRVLHSAPAPQVQWADCVSEAMSDSISAFCYLELQHSDFSIAGSFVFITKSY